MQTNKILILNILLLVLIGCKKNINSQSISNLSDSSKVKKTEPISSNTDYLDKIQDKSFVISCGSGCAMTYTAEKITKNYTNFKVTFNVDMYINEALSDSYKETYLFIYNKNDNVNKIILDDNTKRDALETLPSGARESFIEFSKLLLKPSKINTKDDSFKFSSSILPYQKKIDVKKVIYKSMKVNSIKGLSEFACGEDEIRYISIDKTAKINIILIPQDCGDFQYRFYLMTIKDNSVISSLYVEGESYEPESNAPSEKTNFTIDKNSILTVSTKNKNFEIGVNEEKKYRISDTGELVEIK